MGLEIKDRVVLVTGANRGIGLVLVEEMLRQGAAKVYAAVRDPASAEELSARHGDRLVPLKLDLVDPQSIEDAAKQASDVQIVINNAGILKNAGPMDEGAIEALTQEMDVNVFGLMRIARAFAPVLKRNGGGALVQLNSVASLLAFADFATYGASKAAAYSITQALRDVLGRQGTHVVSVHPGPIATDMAKAAGLDEMAEPPAVVANSIINALRNGEFHAFPDSMAQKVGRGYESFAKNFVEQESVEA
jgi:NAD(P)-dependent dehydrogenase (short-subunit alcohol dehydrogenase family)